jgi:hypothetical protein
MGIKTYLLLIGSVFFFVEKNMFTISDMNLTKLNNKNILEESIYEKSFVNWACLLGLLKRTLPIYC